MRSENEDILTALGVKSPDVEVLLKRLAIICAERTHQILQIRRPFLNGNRRVRGGSRIHVQAPQPQEPPPPPPPPPNLTARQEPPPARRRRSDARVSSGQNTDGVSCGTPPQYITRRGRTVRVTRRARLQDQHSDVCMPSSSNEDEADVLRRPGCRKRSRTVPDVNLHPVPRGVQLLRGTAVREIWGDGAHGIEHRRSLRIVETRGQVALHTDRPGAIKDVQEVGAGPIADGLPVWNHHGKRRRSAPTPQEEVFLNISSNSAHGEGAHGIDHRRSLRLVEAQGRIAWRTSRTVGPPDVLKVGAQLPAETACGVDADASPIPQARIQHRQAINPVACLSSSRRKRYRPTATNDIGAVGAGSIADIRPVGQRQCKRRCQIQRPQRGSLFHHILSIGKP